MLQKFLIKMLIGIVLVCIVNIGVYNYGPTIVCINATVQKGRMEKVYKDLQTHPSFKMIQNVSTVDTINNNIRLTFFVYNNTIWENCEEVLYFMVQSKDYSSIDYSIEH